LQASSRAISCGVGTNKRADQVPDAVPANRLKVADQQGLSTARPAGFEPATSRSGGRETGVSPRIARPGFGLGRRNRSEAVPDDAGPSGIDLDYQGDVFTDQETRPGNALLEGALSVIEKAGLDRGMPYVWAKVLPDNDASSRLFDEHGFDNLGLAGGENDLFRQPGLEPSFRREPSRST
jgi:hypothetical protein